jgi:hypothetical protein
MSSQETFVGNRRFLARSKSVLYTDRRKLQAKCLKDSKHPAMIQKRLGKLDA